MSATTSEDCLFCRIVSGGIPSDVVGETEHSLAFRDIDPAAPTHVLVVPRRHVPDLAGLATASAVEVEATPATTGTRPLAASIVVCTIALRWAALR